MNKAKDQLKIIGFSERRINTFLGYLGDFQDSGLEVEAYLSGTKNVHIISFIRTYYPLLIPANKKIKAIPEQKKYHTMSQKEKKSFKKEIEELTMEKANKNMIQKLEQININLEKYTPLINSPCIGCLNSCIPESCPSLTNYVMG